MNVVKLTFNDLEIDTPIPWAVYDVNDCKLLEAGYVFNSDKKISELIERGVFRDHDVVKQRSASRETEFDDTSSPFILFNDYTERLCSILEHIEDGKQDTQQRVCKLASDIMWLCDRDMEAVLAIIHLPPTHKKYCAFHSVHIAMLSSVLAVRMNMNDEHRASMIAASLTANIGMRNLQELLQRQFLKITEVQRDLIKNHPLASVRLLKAAGIDDELWLDIVAQHHEQVDGQGYPKGLQGDEVLVEASIISIVDVYTAMISKRADRTKIDVQDALREFFVDKGGAYTEELTLQLIKELGIYPPGTFVRLENNEIAVVVKRLIGQSNNPIVKSIIGIDGEKYSIPLMRNTGDKDYRIMESLFYKPTSKINYEQVWGYA